MIIWDGITTYTKDTIVSYNNNKYRAIKDVPENIRITDIEYWEQISKGASVIGRVVPIPQGDWDSNKRYNKLDIVYKDGISYIAKKEVPAAAPIPPLILIEGEKEPTSNEYWQVLAKGTPGGLGDKGEKGDKGDKGDFYYPIFDVDFTTGELFLIYYDNIESKNHPTLNVDDNGNLNVEWG